MTEARFYLIDDDPAFGTALGALLRRRFPDARLLVRTSGWEGVAEVAADEGPSVVFLDYQLPDADGDELLAELRTAGSRAGIIMVTGHSDAQLAADLLRMGADDFLVKPGLNAFHVHRAVEACLERLRLRTELRRTDSELARRNQEIEEKNRALEGALDAQRRHRRELEKLREALEEQVAERTAKLEEANRELLEADRLRTELLRNVTHELRTPLNAIIGYAGLLRQGVYGEVAGRQEEVLDNIVGRAEDLSEMISGILVYSRLEADAETVELAEIDTGELFREVLSTARVLARVSSGDSEPVAVDGATDGAPWVVTDAQKLKQILTNLLSNAVKFTPSGKVELAWDLRGSSLRIEVRDTGHGIPEDQLDVIFEPFRQADGSATRRHGGTGLGLAISRRLAEMLGGTLYAANRPGGGTIMTLRLPAEPRDKSGRPG